jgi:hypothetical protein
LKSRTIVKAIALLTVVGALIAAGTVYVSYLVGDFGECTAIARNSIPSPDGKRYIAVFGTECGATVAFNTQVSIATDW